MTQEQALRIAATTVQRMSDEEGWGADVNRASLNGKPDYRVRIAAQAILDAQACKVEAV